MSLYNSKVILERRSFVIQDIKPHCFSNIFCPKQPVKGDYIFCFQDGKVALLDGQVPKVGDIFPKNPIYLFGIDCASVFLATPEDAEQLPFVSVDVFRKFEPGFIGFAGLTAYHLFHYYNQNRFCGCCGEKMAFSSKERAMLCPKCGLVKYPEIAPAVIVGIINDDKILMTKYSESHSSYQNYGLVAGYTEIGESLEETVCREVMEEVGLNVKDITYYKNQPWGMSDSLLVGYFAKVDGLDKIVMDREELRETRWFTRDEIKEDTNIKSLTGDMIEAFRRGLF